MFPAVFLEIFPKRKLSYEGNVLQETVLSILGEKHLAKDEKKARSQCQGGVIEWRTVSYSITLMVISCTMSEVKDDV